LSASPLAARTTSKSNCRGSKYQPAIHIPAFLLVDIVHDTGTTGADSVLTPSAVPTRS
jgi:hypothetical protein